MSGLVDRVQMAGVFVKSTDRVQVALDGLPQQVTDISKLHGKHQQKLLAQGHRKLVILC